MGMIKITVAWNNGKPAGLWYGDKLMWETGDILPKTNFLVTELYLPVLEALQFCSIFINGITAHFMAELLIAMDMKIKKLQILQEQQEQQEQMDTALEWEDW